MVNARELGRIGRLCAMDAAKTCSDGVVLTTDAGASNLDTERATDNGVVVGPIEYPPGHPMHDDLKVPTVQAPGASVELRVGMPVWAAKPLEDVIDAYTFTRRGWCLHFGIRKHDVGVVVDLPSGSDATVVWKNLYMHWDDTYTIRDKGEKVEWAAYKDRRCNVERSLLLASNPIISPRKGPTELYNTVRDLKGQQPNLTAKQVLEQVCAPASLPEPATLSAVKRCLKLLQQHKRCPLRLTADAFTLIADEMPLAALLNLSATCSEARDVLTHTRLERSKAAVEANDQQHCAFSSSRIGWPVIG